MVDDDIDPAKVFVFAGAGLSRSAPTNLPMFNPLRDAALTSLGFSDYLADWGATETTPQQKCIADLAPEPFFGALQRSGVKIQHWLKIILDPADGSCNAGHAAVAQLCMRGAKVWTVNFDTFIERAQPGIRVIAAPGDLPAIDHCAGQLLKPHGTIDRDLFITPRDVLAPPHESWLQRLRADIDGCRHVVFIGYSGRDFDFRRQWDTVITTQQVLWFDMPGNDVPYKQQLLSRTNTQGRLQFPPCTEHQLPDGTIQRNPTWDFVRWCQQHRLADIPDADLERLLANTPPRRLDGPPASQLTKAEFAAILGDRPRYRRLLQQCLLIPWHARDAAGQLITDFLNTPSAAAFTVTKAWKRLPDMALTGRARHMLYRKHITQLFGAARHPQVIDLTAAVAARDNIPESVFYQRLGSLKMVGDVNTAIDEARDATEQPRSDDNIARSLAAFHWCHGLLWAGRYAQLRDALDNHLRPLASITDTRWMAWADYIDACLHIAAPPGGRADFTAITSLLDAADARFGAEGHLDGLAVTRTVRLTAFRQQRDLTAYCTLATDIERSDSAAPMLEFARQALILELTQMLAYHCGATAEALARVELLRRSSFPIHVALATALAGQWDTDADRAATHLRAAAELATSCGLTRIAEFAGELLTMTPSARLSNELFYP